MMSRIASRPPRRGGLRPAGWLAALVGIAGMGEACHVGVSTAAAQVVSPRPVPLPIPIPTPRRGPIPVPTLPAPGPGQSKASTTILADSLQMDMGKENENSAIFSGNVRVTGTDMKLTCNELRVKFGEDNKVTAIVASGAVDIIQPNSHAKAHQADYDMVNNIVLLTGAPVITDP